MIGRSKTDRSMIGCLMIDCLVIDRSMVVICRDIELDVGSYDGVVHIRNRNRRYIEPQNVLDVNN